MTALVRSAARRRGRTRKWEMGIGTAGGGGLRKVGRGAVSQHRLPRHSRSVNTLLLSLVVTPWLEDKREREKEKVLANVQMVLRPTCKDLATNSTSRTIDPIVNGLC